MRITSGTIARTIVLALALLNQFCAIMGWSPLDISEDLIYQACTAISTVVAGLWAWWKNNSFTEIAREGDAHMDLLKLTKGV